MKQRPRIYYSETQKALMWDRWRKGDTIHEIARLFDRGHSSVQRILSDMRGIRPAQRHRAAYRTPSRSVNVLPRPKIRQYQATRRATCYLVMPIARSQRWLNARAGS